MGDGVEVAVADRPHHDAADIDGLQPSHPRAELGLGDVVVGEGALRQACRPVAQAGLDVGVHHARAEHRHADLGALRPQLQRQGLAEGHDAELGDRIAAGAGPHPEAAHRGGVDHVAPVRIGLQHRQEGLDAMDHALEVDAEDPVPVGRGHVGDLGAGADPGVVADHVHGPEPAADLLGQGLDALQRGDVAA